MTDPDAMQLRPPRNQLDPRAQAYWRMQGVLSGVPQAAAVAAIGIAFDVTRPWVWLVLVASVAWSLVMIFVAPAWRMRIHRWEVTDEAVYASFGWWAHEWRIAPVSRIQTIDTVRGPLQRRYSLSSVTVTTASAAGPITIEGLDHELAEELVARLTEATDAVPGDAT